MTNRAKGRATSTIAITALSISDGERNPMPIHVSTTFIPIAISNGSYGFVVPYSTEGPIEGGTNYDVLATPHIIRTGQIENETIVWDREKEMEVGEKEVMEGKTARTLKSN